MGYLTYLSCSLLGYLVFISHCFSLSLCHCFISLFFHKAPENLETHGRFYGLLL
jgi:hypothetical protein